MAGARLSWSCLRCAALSAMSVSSHVSCRHPATLRRVRSDAHRPPATGCPLTACAWRRCRSRRFKGAWQLRQPMWAPSRRMWARAARASTRCRAACAHSWPLLLLIHSQHLAGGGARVSPPPPPPIAALAPETLVAWPATHKALWLACLARLPCRHASWRRLAPRLMTATCPSARGPLLSTAPSRRGPRQIRGPHAAEAEAAHGHRKSGTPARRLATTLPRALCPSMTVMSWRAQQASCCVVAEGAACCVVLRRGAGGLAVRRR